MVAVMWQAIRHWGSRSDLRMWTVIVGLWLCTILLAVIILTPVVAMLYGIPVTLWPSWK